MEQPLKPNNIEYGTGRLAFLPRDRILVERQKSAEEWTIGVVGVCPLGKRRGGWGGPCATACLCQSEKR
jgi:hypothetical protein